MLRPVPDLVCSSSLSLLVQGVGAALVREGVGGEGILFSQDFTPGAFFPPLNIPDCKPHGIHQSGLEASRTGCEQSQAAAEISQQR